MRCDQWLSLRTSRAGRQVFVVEVPWKPAVASVDMLVRLLVGPSPQPRCRSAQRVHVDDALFDVAMDELVDDFRSDDAVVVQSSSRLAGIRSLPEAEDSAASRDREVLRLREALGGHT